MGERGEGGPVAGAWRRLFVFCIFVTRILEIMLINLFREMSINLIFMLCLLYCMFNFKYNFVLYMFF